MAFFCFLWFVLLFFVGRCKQNVLTCELDLMPKVNKRSPVFQNDLLVLVRDDSRNGKGVILGKPKIDGFMRGFRKVNVRDQGNRVKQQRQIVHPSSPIPRRCYFVGLAVKKRNSHVVGHVRKLPQKTANRRTDPAAGG